MVEGVTDGFEKRLEIQGVGYRAQLQGQEPRAGARLLAPGHRSRRPEGIEFEVPQPTEIVVRGIDKQLVGEIAARHPQAPPAGALQGQGHPLRAASTSPARSVSALMTVSPSHSSGCAAAAACGPGSAARAERPRLSVYRSNRGVFAQLIDDDAGHTLAAVNWTEAELRKLDADGAGEAGRRAARRARQGGRRRDLRLRPRRLPLPRPRRGARRGRPRGGPGVLMAATVSRPAT